MHETQFRKDFRYLLQVSGVWTASVEHRSGATSGIPDLLVRVDQLLLPVELKLGELCENTETIRCSKIRPTQIRFLDEFSIEGGRARLVIGVYQRKMHWQCWCFRKVTRDWLRRYRRDGFPLHELLLIASNGKLHLPPDEW